MVFMHYIQKCGIYTSKLSVYHRWLKGFDLVQFKFVLNYQVCKHIPWTYLGLT